MRTEYAVRFRGLALIIILAVIVSLFPATKAYGYTKEYGYQGSDKPVYVPGKGEREPNSLKLLDYESGEITVEKTPDECDYFLNTIHRELDGTEKIEFAFSMTAGMNQPFDVATGKLNFEKNCLAGVNEDGTLRKSMVNVYKKTEEYTGNWNQDENRAPIGKLQVDYDPNKTYANPTNGDNQGRITLYVPADTLEAGEYILEFGKNVCGNQTEKILGYPVAFEFSVQGNPDLDSAIDLAKQLYAYVSVSEHIGKEVGQYDLTSEEIDSLMSAIKEAEAVQKTSDESIKSEAAKSLNEKILFIEKKRIVVLDAVIDGLEDDSEVSVGTVGTLKKRVVVEPGSATNVIYQKATWSAKTDNISIDSKSGIWSANSAGEAKIALISGFNGSVIKELTFKVKNPVAERTAFYIPGNSSLSKVVENGYLHKVVGTILNVVG